MGRCPDVTVPDVYWRDVVLEGYSMRLKPGRRQGGVTAMMMQLMLVVSIVENAKHCRMEAARRKLSSLVSRTGFFVALFS